jgi:hypothetical protein
MPFRLRPALHPGAVKWIVGLLVTLCVAVAAGVAWWYSRHQEPPPEDPQISVVSHVGEVRIVSGWEEAAKLRERYPFQSLNDRLAYESPSPAPAAPKLAGETSQRLEQFENVLTTTMVRDSRTRSLRALHSTQVDRFVDAEGLGVSRMVVPTGPSFLEYPPTTPIPFDYVSDSATDEDRQGTPGPVTPAGTTSDRLMTALHLDSMVDFLDPSGYGLVKDRGHVAGFEPHQFRQKPIFGDPKFTAVRPAPKKELWLLRRLELVSMLKHEKPVAYVSESLPRMQELGSAATRLLTVAEQKALESLRHGEDLVAVESTNRIQMVGSLRAAKQCLSCHQVQRGDLLGAFTYDLRRVPGRDD